MSEEERLRRRSQREKTARIQAERILEEKSRELYDRNHELQMLSASLEKQVAQRTQDLIETRDNALAAAKAKSQFMANMSHEIRTPLNGLLGMLNMLVDGELSQEQHELLQNAKHAGSHLLEIVNDILDFSKIEAGEMQLYEEPIDLFQELEQTLVPLSHVAQEKGLDLMVEIDSDFPEYIQADGLRIRQVVTNLVSNSIKFTKEGYVECSVEILSPQQYQIRVTDTGIGMTEEQIEKIFSAFGQADESITRKFGGTGLGLTITQSFINMMGGKIEVESELNEGTTFKVTFPMLPAEAPEESVDQIINENIMFQHETVLLVDDNEVNLNVARYILEQAGLRVETCSNGQQAVEAIVAKAYPVVLMDIQMPVLDGLEASRHIRMLESDRKQTPIIAMTAHATKEHVQESMDAGMDGHLTKPIEPVILYRELAKYLEVDPNAKQELIDDGSVGQVETPDQKIEQHSLIDYSQALARVGGKEALLKKIIGMFMSNYENVCQELQEAIESKDWETVRTLSHSVKGSAANISANVLSESAAELELSIKASQLTNVSDLFEKFSCNWQKLMPELEHYLSLH